MKKAELIILLAFVAAALTLFALFLRNNKGRDNINIQEYKMKITSPDFSNSELIPKRFTCDGEDINPEIHISDVPENAKSLALIVEDPDAPGKTFLHWTLWNISPDVRVIKPGEKPDKAVEGITDFGRTGYGGPCPPPGWHHRYFFTLYALDSALDLPQGSNIDELKKEIDKHTVSKSELIGLYKR